MLETSRPAVQEISLKIPDEILDELIERSCFQRSSEDSTSGGPLFNVSLLHSPIFIAGRYLKNARDIYQSPWIDKDIPSVSEYISNVASRHFIADSAKFSAAGREDIDVKMLGQGRPFILEMANPKKVDTPLSDDKICEEIKKESSGKVVVNKLWKVDGPSACNALKIGEETKSKVYRAVVYSSLPLSSDILEKINSARGPLMVDQKTPIRVLHRRANMLRKKTVYEMKATIASSDIFVLDLTTQAGM